MSRLTAIIIAVAICIIVSLGWMANHYRDNASEYKKQRDEKTQALKLANATIADMTTRQRDVATLDAKYTQEATSWTFYGGEYLLHSRRRCELRPAIS